MQNRIYRNADPDDALVSDASDKSCISLIWRSHKEVLKASGLLYYCKKLLWQKHLLNCASQLLSWSSLGRNPRFKIKIVISVCCCIGYFCVHYRTVMWQTFEVFCSVSQSIGNWVLGSVMYGLWVYITRLPSKKDK